MLISSASKNDYPEMVEVWEASVRATHLFISEEDIVTFRSLVPKFFDLVDLFVVRTEGGIQGFLGTGDEELQMLFLHPRSIGKGFGKLLTSFATDVCGVKKVEVNEQNQQAVGFYKHMGFRVVGRAEVDYVGKPYPLLFMEL